MTQPTPNAGAASSAPTNNTGSLNAADPPGTSVFVYSPDIKVYIDTEKNGVIDVSPDIIAAQVKRVENSASLASVTLNNSKGHYSYNGKSIIQPMDKIIIYLSKIQTVKVFSGYVDTVPFLDLFPTTCDIQATCTLKRLMYMYWDPGLTESEQILDQNKYMGGQANGGAATANPQATTTPNGTPAAGAVAGTPPAAPGATAPAGAKPGTVSDSGLGAMLLNLLVKVGGWPKDSIKIQDFPTEFLKFAIATQTDPGAYATAITQLQQMLGFGQGTDGSGGGALLAGQYSGNIPQTPGNYGGVNLNATQLHYADLIAGTGKAMNMSKQAVMIALMTAMQESNLGLAGMTVAVDHDSLGLFQQRPSTGWGTPQECMDPTHSSQSFFTHLMKVPGWQTMDPGAAAQAVQSSAFPGAYSKWQSMATALVNASSVGTGTPTAPAPAAPGGAPAPSVSATAPGGTAASGGGNAPADKAIAFALAQVGKPYVWGAKGPDSWDCSGLTWGAWNAAGKNIGQGTQAQLGSGTPLPADNASTQPGDLWFPSQHVDYPGGHVALVIGPNTIVEAPQPGQPVHVTAMYSPAYANRRIDPVAGQPKGANDAVPGSGATGAAGGSATPPWGYGLFNVMFQTAHFEDPLSDQLKGDRALINDVQLLQMVQSVCKASLRSFQSSPDGDFVAYYPDYFGIHNNATVMALYDIEMIDVKVTRSDLPMATHVFTIGDTIDGGIPNLANSANFATAAISTQGVVTIDDADIFQMLLGIDPKTNPDFSASYIYKRYGARPITQQFAMIGQKSLERFQAIHLFMQKWSDQYATQVEVTFMPDLFPGMRIQLAGHNLYVYVSEVTHNIDRAHGFTTTLMIKAPSTTVNGLAGLPISRSGVDTSGAANTKPPSSQLPVTSTAAGSAPSTTTVSKSGNVSTITPIR